MDEDTALSFSRDPPLMGGEKGEGRERGGEGTVMSAPQATINPDLLTASKGSLHL